MATTWRNWPTPGPRGGHPGSSGRLRRVPFLRPRSDAPAPPSALQRGPRAGAGPHVRPLRLRSGPSLPRLRNAWPAMDSTRQIPRRTGPSKLVRGRGEAPAGCSPVGGHGEQRGTATRATQSRSASGWADISPVSRASSGHPDPMTCDGSSRSRPPRPARQEPDRCQRSRRVREPRVDVGCAVRQGGTHDSLVPRDRCAAGATFWKDEDAADECGRDAKPISCDLRGQPALHVEAPQCLLDRHELGFDLDHEQRPVGPAIREDVNRSPLAVDRERDLRVHVPSATRDGRRSGRTERGVALVHQPVEVARSPPDAGFVARVERREHRAQRPHRERVEPATLDPRDRRLVDAGLARDIELAEVSPPANRAEGRSHPLVVHPLNVPRRASLAVDRR